MNNFKIIAGMALFLASPLRAAGDDYCSPLFDALIHDKPVLYDLANKPVEVPEGEWVEFLKRIGTSKR